MSTTSAETLYTFRTPFQDVLVRGRLNKVSMEVHRNGALVAPTASGSTFSLIGPDGTAIVDAAAITVTGSIATYSIPALTLPSTLTLGEGYQERWTLVLTDRTETVDREASLCVRPLYPVIAEADLTRRYTNLGRLLPNGATTWQPKIDAAWAEIIRRLWADGLLPYGIKSQDQLFSPLFHLAMSYIYEDISMAQPTVAVWADKARDHLEKYEGSWVPATWRTDDNLDGTVDDPSKRRGSSPVVQFNGSPDGDVISSLYRSV